MGRVIIDMSPSLDGFIAGNGISTESPFGDIGHRLHHWLGFDGASPTAADRAAAARMFASAGAVVLGRRMFDVGIELWGADGAFGKPCFVVTRRPAKRLIKGPTTFEFCQDTETALALAQKTAGDLDVIVAGGADIARQCLASGVVDEVRLHVVPVLLGSGASLFPALVQHVELDTVEVTCSPLATHVTYRVIKPSQG